MTFPYAGHVHDTGDIQLKIDEGLVVATTTEAQAWLQTELPRYEKFTGDNIVEFIDRATAAGFSVAWDRKLDTQ